LDNIQIDDQLFSVCMLFLLLLNIYFFHLHSVVFLHVPS